MLAIRFQRIGRRGQAAYRMVVQDSHWSPKSGKVVAFLGSYDPHSKTININTEKATEFIKNGAQPSPKVAQLLRKEGQKLPKWVAKPVKKSGKVRNPDKKAKAETAPSESPVQEQIEEPVEDADSKPVEDEPEAEAVATEQNAAETETAKTEEAAEASAPEKSAEEPKTDS